MPDETTSTLAVVVARLDDLRTDFAAMRTEVRQAAGECVTRGEWGQRNQHVDTRINSLGREVGDLRKDIDSRRAPWWSVFAVTLAAAGLVWSIVGPVVSVG